MNLINYNQIGLKLQKVSNYLTGKQNYEQLVDKLEKSIDQLKTKKPTVRLVSNSSSLLAQIQDISSANQKLSDQTNFQILHLKQNFNSSFDDCEFVCLIYNCQLPISTSEKQFIERVNKKNIPQLIIIINNNCHLGSSEIEDNLNDCQTWLNQLPDQQLEQVILSSSDRDLLNSSQLTNYYCLIEQLSERALTRSANNIYQTITEELHQYFESEKKAHWRSIYEQKKEFLQENNPDNFKQTLNQTIQKLNREQQQIFKNLRQTINQSKLDLVNPFISTSLIYQVQQVIEKAETTEIKDNDRIYLYLTIKNPKYFQKLHIYGINLCQEFLSQWLTREWNLIGNFYAEGGIKQLLRTTENELQFLADLNLNYFKFELVKQPSFELTNFISVAVLEEMSRIPFDYHYTYSSWFRILVASLVGLTIFLVTGKLFGFVILVFQFINLFTSQDAKTIRLKQQTKELKRNVDNKYQFLVRFLAERVGQILITALDDASQQYQTDLDVIAQNAEEKLAAIKTTINQSKDKIDELKQDQMAIEKLLL